MSVSTIFILTTDPGLEPILEQEWTQRTSAYNIDSPVVWHKFKGMKGVVMIESHASLEVLLPILEQMRSVHHAYRLLHQGKLDVAQPVQHIQQTVQQLEISEMEAANSFRVTVSRIGDQVFSSYDIAVASGAAIQAHYGTAVNLEEYDVNIRVDVVRDSWWTGVQLYHKALSNRFVRALHHNVSLKPTIAYGLLRLAGITQDDQGPLLDPFCGSGTLLMEAAQVFPQLKIIGSDIFPEPIETSQQNIAQNLQHPERIQLHMADARRLSESFEPNSIKYIVTNPPYGIRVGKNLRFYWFYYHFLDQAHQVMQEDGRLVLLVLRVQFFRDAMRKLGLWHVQWSQKIELGGKRVKAYVLSKSRPQ
ncbi:MAG: methyltransferase [Bacteroidota bacterium]